MKIKYNIRVIAAWDC